MKRTSVLAGIIVGAATSLLVIAITILGALSLGLPLVPLDIFDWMARVLPGAVISFGISTMVNLIGLLKLGPTDTTAKLAEQMMGLGTLVITGIVFGGLLAFFGRRDPERLPRYGLVGGLILLVITVLIEGALGFNSGLFTTLLWLAVLFLGWGWMLGRLLRGPLLPEPVTPAESPAPHTPTELSRRDFIYLGAASVAAVVVGGIGLDILRRAIPSTGSSAPATGTESVTLGQTSGPAASPPENVLTSRIAPAPGTRPELTSNADFYRIDIDTFPPNINEGEWRLELAGLVNKPLSLSLDDIRSRPSVTQVVTMQCISNPVAGDLTGTTQWTGVPLKNILAEAQLKPGVKGLAMEAKDGFYEYIALEDAMDERTLLVYNMNGVPLPQQHGFPLRIYIPDRYGMKQPKWLTRMEAVDKEQAGYWVERGWDFDAIVKTTSVIDAVAVDNQDPNTKTIPVGGIAWAGARGISKVEVQVDNGPWMPAMLRQPPLSTLSWVQWRYDWPSQPGTHRFSVRAYDGSGKAQDTTVLPPEFSGASGIHSVEVNVR